MEFSQVSLDKWQNIIAFVTYAVYMNVKRLYVESKETVK